MVTLTAMVDAADDHTQNCIKVVRMKIITIMKTIMSAVTLVVIKMTK